ncbi:helix-turn-helix domain-containing protein [Leadbettera azotonutricia]|uniref:Transcriptional regulator, LuxR family protein n=1 Tax=Leadbettera azotonutricia (strain ATCC BAA-888 / DSM 13862 / ZAS-9) TaxID=545695 RepID=F5Y941_LEAAZ|nr:helix-turn-helix transcriptional regulator [Leadbettera azotonutricia]AEF80977.1 transcriptional regulator, LuxR family protein [Leadbettera azotonutricia ZAS-9]
MSDKDRRSFARQKNTFTFPLRPHRALIPTVLFSAAVIVFVILLINGKVSSGSTELERTISRERSSLAGNLEKRLGEVSVEALLYAQTLSHNIEIHLENAGLSIGELSGKPETLLYIEETELGLALLALDKARVSGVFMALEATINPRLKDAEYSRAGFSIQNTEPFIPGNAYKLFLRGFADLAYKNNLAVHSLWDLELDSRGSAFYTVPVETFRKNPSLPLSRSYYWTFEDSGGVYKREEPALLCSVPLISSQGKLLGVCGFEISAANFRLNHSPLPGPYPRLISRFGPSSGNGVETDSAFYSGPLALGRGGFIVLGSGKRVKLYPANSPYLDDEMALDLLMPRQDYNSLIVSHNAVLAVILVLLGGGIYVLSFLLNRYYRKAYVLALMQMETRLAKSPPDFAQYGLSRREQEICVLLLKGFTLRQIGGELFISFNTVNNHCRSIYQKLGISHRQELFAKLEG